MAHCAQSPSFILHQVTCQFATGETLFGPLNVSLENSLCGLVGRNGVGKTRLLRLLAGIDTPSGGHIERPVSLACVAQQHTITPQTTLAALLGYGPHFAALQRLGRGEALADDVVGFSALDIGDKAHAAGVVFVARIVKALGLWKSHPLILSCSGPLPPENRLQRKSNATHPATKCSEVARMVAMATG